MTSQSWLLLDVSFLAHRAMHSTGTLHHKGNATGALFGMFREIFSLRSKFGADYVCWCFDDRKENLYRRKDFPGYKLKPNQQLSPEQKKIKDDLIRQLKDLYNIHLPKAGCQNVTLHKGYEADDVIAWYIKGLRYRQFTDKTTVIIVSSDQDLYQLLGKRDTVKTVIYNPMVKSVITLNTFVEQYGIFPNDWPTYKAIAGCTSDRIPGVKGVGPATALKWLTGREISETMKVKIKAGMKTIREFERLTILPYCNPKYPGLPSLTKTLGKDNYPRPIKDKEQSSEAWQDVFRDLGFSSFIKGD